MTVKHVLAIAVVVLVGAVSCAVSARRSGSRGGVTDDKYHTTWKAALFVPCTGNVTLRADAFVPTPKHSGEKFPVVIFPNSWGCPQIEYITRALGLAERGYVAMEYETRGWFTSQGQIDTAGPLDRQDGSTMIDFVASKAAEWNADMSKVAFMGISYGAGISLEMAGHDERVTTAIAMSGWNNMTLMMYGNEAPNTDVLQGLVDAAERDGNVTHQLQGIVDGLKNHTNMAAFSAFTETRSPQIFLEQFNVRKVPLMLSSNYLDHLFRPQYMHAFFELLTGPKLMLLNQGTHALPEGLGVLVHDNFIWSHAFAWLDRWLKNNTDNGIMSEPEIQAQLGNSVFDATYVPYSRANKSTVSLWPTPVDAQSGQGGLSADGTALPSGTSAPIHFTTHVGLKEGDGKDLSFGKPDNVSLVQPAESTIVFVSGALSQDKSLTLCGTPELDFRIETSADDWQLYTFMYRVPSGTSARYGDLWSRGFYNHYASGPTAGPAATRNADGSYSVKGAQLHTICKTVEPGDRLALGVVLYDRRFTPASTNVSVAFVYGADTELRVPFVTY